MMKRKFPLFVFLALLSLTACSSDVEDLVTFTPVYTVVFDPNGGNGSVRTQSFAIGFEQNLLRNSYYRENYNFTGWNTSSTGYGKSYDDGMTVKDLANKNGDVVILYAQWQAAVTYTVVFDANGGTGTMESQTFTVGTARHLPYNTYRKENFSFVGWNTSADGSGIMFSDGMTVNNLSTENEATVTLYAQWKPYVTYTVNFDANGGTGTMSRQTLYLDTAQSLSANTFTRAYHRFARWNTQADGSGMDYADKESVTNLTTRYGSITLYAQWEPLVHYTVIFTANGGTGDDVRQEFVIDVAHALSANTFTKDGQSFLKWNTEADGSGTSYADGESVRNISTTDGEVITLYAQWVDGIVITSENYETVLKGLSGEDTYVIRYVGSVPTDSSWSSSVSGTLSKISGLIDDLYPAKVTLDLSEVTKVTNVSGFDNCRPLIKVLLPDGITSVGSFYGCVNLRDIALPGTVTSIKSFYNCKSLVTITLPDGVTDIPYAAFRNCTSLVSIKLSDNIKTIGEEAFYGCANLENITLPKKLQSIGSYAFYGCTKFTSITFPIGVSNIGSRAFSGCNSLSNVTYEGTIAQWNVIVISEYGIGIKKVICTDGEVTL